MIELSQPTNAERGEPETESLPIFQPFPKIGRLSREIVVTEKIDGSNACIYISDAYFITGSRNRWITPMDDNFGFSAWAHFHKEELIAKLGPGVHHGEWWGQGIQRRYNLTEKRFSLFNTSRWTDDSKRPSCCHVVPVLYTGDFDTGAILAAMSSLTEHGSRAAPGWMKPEGVVIFHGQSNVSFKKTFEKDDAGKNYGG